MPGGGHALTIERVKFVNPKFHGLSRWGDAEQRTTMRTGDLGANSDFARCLHHVPDGDANVWKCCDDASDDGFDRTPRSRDRAEFSMLLAEAKMRYRKQHVGVTLVDAVPLLGSIRADAQ